MTKTGFDTLFILLFFIYLLIVFFSNKSHMCVHFSKACRLFSNTHTQCWTKKEKVAAARAQLRSAFCSCLRLSISRRSAAALALASAAAFSSQQPSPQQQPSPRSSLRLSIKPSPQQQSSAAFATQLPAQSYGILSAAWPTSECAPPFPFCSSTFSSASRRATQCTPVSQFTTTTTTIYSLLVMVFFPP